MTFAQGHDRSSFFTARMRSRAIHPASEAASGVEFDQEIERLQRTDEAIVVATAAPRERGCPAWVVLGHFAGG